jgi:L-ascorbate metabolism protein UlaG (beta-lactamase superfamily)
MSRFPVSDHCDGSRFHTPGAPPVHGLSAVLRWRFTRRVAAWTPQSITPQAPPAAPSANSPDVIATWVNHSTFLLQFDGFALLTDPVFSECIGLFGLIGPRRVHAPGIAFDSLPKIDAVLLSHDHYDHCDLPTLRRLSRSHDPFIIAPLGHRALLKRAGLARVVELDWWQSHRLTARADTRDHVETSRSSSRALSITLTPAQHWSNRVTGPRCGRLWGGFFLSTDQRRLFFAGDTGYHPAFFQDIRTRLGAPDLALLPIGAYEPRWFMHDQHVNPAEAVQIHRDLGARTSVGMHWGTFQLTDEARLDPPQALRKSLAEANIPEESFRVMEPGHSLPV